jgi:tetratricopeptide (TPR) repeat protein
MDLQASLLRQLDNPDLSRDSRAELRCQIAKELEKTGEYEAARQAMGELWRRIGERPKIEGLEQSTAGEVLLRAGVLTGIIGSKNQIPDAQEAAKNLITESLTLFQSLHYAKKVAEAQTELALCYWRTGEYEEASDVLKEALSQLKTDSELKALALLRWVLVERGAARYADALRILTDNAQLFEKINNLTVKGSYHVTLANVLEDLWESEKQSDYIDRAFVEYAAASYYFEQAGHKSYLANVENNLGYLHFKAGRYKEAHEYLNRARHLIVSLKDNGTLAQYDETRARVFLAQGNYAEAERVARSAVRTLEKCGRQSLLAESLITHGRALARLCHYGQALSAFQRAIEIARQTGALARAAEAALAAFEELGEHLSSDEITAAPSGLALGEEVRRYEHELIKQALAIGGGSVTNAARILGVTHQRLAYMLDTRHKDLLPARSPVIHRRKRKP